MNHPTATASTWSTASFGDDTDTSPMKLSALGEHLGLCRKLQGRRLALRCAAETTHGVLAARFITTLVAAAALVAAASMLG